jgi:hypothetical protein
VSSYADHAILALPVDAPARHWRLLAALGTFKPYPDGSVRVSQPKLAEVAGLHPDTVKQARRELVKAGVLDYQAGRGAGIFSAYRIKGGDIATPLFDDYRPAEKGGRSPEKRGGTNRPDQGKQLSSMYVPKPGRTTGAVLRPAPAFGAGSLRSPAPRHREGGKMPKHTPSKDQAPLWPATVQPEPGVIEGKVVGQPPPPSAQTLVGEWLDHCQMRPPQRITGQVARELAGLLGEGIDYDVVRRGLAAWHQRGQHPSTLASFVNAAGNAPQAGNGGRPAPAPPIMATALELARQLRDVQ